MRRYHASWHKTCRLKFNQTSLSEKKRRGTNCRSKETAQEEGTNFGMHTCSSVGRPVSSVIGQVPLQGFTVLALMTSTGRLQ